MGEAFAAGKCSLFGIFYGPDPRNASTSSSPTSRHRRRW